MRSPPPPSLPSPPNRRPLSLRPPLQMHAELTDERTAGLSSMRKFAGCDTEAQVRKRLQAEQMKRWLDAQSSMAAAAKAAKVEEDRRWAEHNKQLYTLRTEIEEQRAVAEKASKRQQYAFAQEAREFVVVFCQK